MKKQPLNVIDIITASIAVKNALIQTSATDIAECGKAIAESCMAGNKILFCGNGGSAADAQHIAAELVIRFRSSVNRAAIPAMALTVDPSVMTAGGNDIGFDNIFAREVEAFGHHGDVLVGISTSGNSENIIRAFIAAREKGMITVGLLGCGGGKMKELCDYSVIVPSDVTARIQESHIMIGHIWCEIIEETLFPELF